MAPTRTWPPLAATASEVFSASSVVRYTDQTSGMPMSGWAGMQPATPSPSLGKLKYPPYSSVGSWASQPKSWP